MSAPSLKEVLDLVSCFTDNTETLDFYCAVAGATETLVKAAIAEERERCAKIVDMAYREFDGWGKDPKVDACRSVLSAIIRSGDSGQNWADAPNSVDPLTAAERARCAKIAEQIKKAAFRFMSDDDIGFNEACEDIAAKIRSGE